MKHGQTTEVYETCPNCNGTGKTGLACPEVHEFVDGKYMAVKSCSRCGGSGQIYAGGSGMFSSYYECSACRGTGKEYGFCFSCGSTGMQRCPRCDGAGRIRK